MAKSYTVSDGKLVLTLKPAEEGGYIVTSPLEPELITEAETIDEAFRMAHDAVRALHVSPRQVVAATGGFEALGMSRREFQRICHSHRDRRILQTPAASH